MTLLLGLTLACSGGPDPAPGGAAALEIEPDPCCHAGDPGSPLWEECRDKTVLEHVCARAEICCTVQWAAPCASGYGQFASTCTAEQVAALGPMPKSATPGGAQPGSGNVGTAELVDPTWVKVPLHVEMTPPPDKLGGSVFYAGFAEFDDRVGMPVKGARPADYGAVGRWVQEFPVDKEVDLVEGLHYFVMYGFGEHPLPGDRMAPLQQVRGDGPLTFVITTRTIPAEDETPPGGRPGAAPSQ